MLAKYRENVANAFSGYLLYKKVKIFIDFQNLYLGTFKAKTNK